jgi:hypothetical protein
MEVNMMIKKRKFIFKIATLLIAYATAIPTAGSILWIGEPQLPKQLSK